MNPTSSRTPDWENNKEVKNCRLCLKNFTFSLRRHHCRSCGRLVCNPCSSKRLILNQNNESNDDKPLRVCDDCYKSLTTRKEYNNGIKIKREKQESLLQMSSIISDNLLRVFLLDGSFKVISYDDDTTAAELANEICFSVKCALFETIDLNNSDQYKMISYNEAVINVIARWNLHNITNAKFMIPIYDIESCSKDNTPPTFRFVANTNKDLLPLLEPSEDVVSSPSRRDSSQSPSRTGRIFTKILKIDKNSSSNATTTTAATTKVDSNDIEFYKKRLVELTEKYEMVASLLAKKNGSSDSATAVQPTSLSAATYSTPTKQKGGLGTTAASSSSLYKKPTSTTKNVETVFSQVYENVTVETSPYRSLETLAILGRDDIIVATNTDDLSLLLNTFFYQINGLENFIVRYENILKSIISVPASSDEHDNRLSLEILMKNTTVFSQVYEMASALESLFEMLQIFSCRFTFNVKRWLLDSLKNSLNLRASNPDMIASILHCLNREKLVVGDEISAIITNFIDECFYGNRGQTGEYTTAQILSMLERMLLLLHLIVDDLVSVLSSFDLMRMYEDRFFHIFRDDITTFYFTNRQQIRFNDLLQILSYVESINRKFESISIDTTMIKELISDIMKKLTTVTETNTQSLLATFHESDEKVSPTLLESDNFKGLGSKWPQQLISHLEETFQTVSQMLQPPSRENIYICILNTLPEFLTKQSFWLKKIEVGTYSRDVSIERLCAYMNNHAWLSDMLNTCQHSLLSKSEEEAGQCFSKCRLLFTVSPALSANILSQICTSDIKGNPNNFVINTNTNNYEDILKAGLFKSGYSESVGSQFGGSKVVTIVATALNKHHTDLQIFLCPEVNDKPHINI